MAEEKKVGLAVQGVATTKITPGDKHGDMSMSSSSEIELSDEKRSSGFTSDNDSDQYTQSFHMGASQEGSNKGLPYLGKLASRDSRSTKNSGLKSNNSKGKRRRSSRKPELMPPVDLAKDFLEAPISARGRGRSPRRSPRSAAKGDFEKTIVIVAPPQMGKNLSQNQPPSSDSVMKGSTIAPMVDKPLSPIEKKTIQFKEDLYEEPLVSQVHNMTDTTKSPPSIMKRATNEMTKVSSQVQPKPPIATILDFPAQLSNLPLKASTPATQESMENGIKAEADSIIVEGLESEASPQRKIQFYQSDVNLGPRMNLSHLRDNSNNLNRDEVEHVEDRSDTQEVAPCESHSFQSSSDLQLSKANSLKYSDNPELRVLQSSEISQTCGTAGIIDHSSPLRVEGGLLKLQADGFGLRRMQTQTQTTSVHKNLGLRPKNKNSGVVSIKSKESALRNREVSFKAKSRLNSRQGRSEKSYLTFAPPRITTPDLDEQNLRVNQVSEQAINDQLNAIQTTSKHLYSKESFATFASMKSVLKPRMIHLIKQGRQQAREENLEKLDSSSDQSRQLSNSLSEPATSDSNSVYSHIRQNYLETNESQSIEMCLERDNYHMKKNFKEDTAADLKAQKSQKRSSMENRISCLNLLSDEESKHSSVPQPANKIRRNMSTTSVKQSGLNLFQRTNNKVANFEKPASGGIVLSEQLELKSLKSLKQKKKFLPKKHSEKKKVKKKEVPDFSIRDDFSISDDDDKSNMMHALTFMYYFPNKVYFICHRRKIYGYTPNSFNKLGYDNIIRQLAIWIVEWPWFDRISIFLIVVNSLGLGMLDYEYSNLMTDFPDLVLEIPFLNRLMEQIEYFFTICFTLEMVIKMIAHGLILDKNCYLRDYWNWLDCIVVIGSILAYLPNFSNVTVLRTFRLFKPLRSLRTLPSMQELVVTLLDSVMQLTNVFFLLVFALLVFSILGVQIWRGVTHFKCRTTEAPIDGIWPIAEDNNDVCGGLNMCNADANQVCGSLRDPQWAELLEGHEAHLYSDPQSNNDIINFDNIFKATISMFQVATLEGWYNLMNLMMNGYNKYITMIFFVSAIQICHYLLFNMTLAVMVCNLRKQKEDEFNELIDRQVDLQRKISERRKALKISSKEQKESCAGYLRIALSLLIKVQDDEKEPPEQRYNSNFIVCLWRMTTHITYKTLFLAIVIINVVILAYDEHQEKTDKYMRYKNRDSHILVFSTLAFNIDIILKLCAFELKAFYKDRLNMMDCLLCIFFTGLFVVDQINTGHFSLEYEDLYYSNRYAFFGALRLLRVIMFARALQTIRVLLDCIAFTFDSVGNFLVLLFIFIYVFSLLGMQCFAGRLIFDSQGRRIQELTDVSQIDQQYIPRSNFDDIGKSFVTVFQILIGEHWNEVFYDCWKGSGAFVASGYFITLIFFGNIMMLNLFLAMLLGNFERASLISEVSNEESKLAELMPIGATDLLASQEGHNNSGQVIQVKSILRPPSNFEELFVESPQTTSKKLASKPRHNRPGRLGSYPRKSCDSLHGGEKNQKKDVDSSYDSQQSLQKVRLRYQNKKLDSVRARFDRRVSFAAYTIDPYFNVPAEDENGTGFQINHFYDEPSPSLFNDSDPSGGENSAGKRLRSMSVPATSPDMTPIQTKKFNSFSGGPRPVVDRQTSFTGALRLNLATGAQKASNNLEVPEVAANQEHSDRKNKENLIGIGLIRQPAPEGGPSRARPPRPLPISIPQSKNPGAASKLVTDSSPASVLKRPRKEPLNRSINSSHSMIDQNHFDKDLIVKAMAYGNLMDRKPLKVQTGENPKKMQMILERSRELKEKQPPGDQKGVPMRERLVACFKYMRNSSLGCFHKRTRFRRRLIMIVTGGIQRPLFKTVDQLVDFYCQKVQRDEDKPQADSDEDAFSSSEESVKNDYSTKTESQKFLEDHNSSFFIDEVLRVQQSSHFSYQNLRDQLSTIKVMQESGRYDHIFVGNTLKNKGMFYLTEKHDIKITFPKWYQLRAHTIFIQVMNLAVVVSSLTLAFDSPFDEPNSLRQQILSTIDIVLTVLFSIEAIIKIIATGFCKSSLTGNKRKAYLQDPNNVLDLFLVIIQIAYLFGKYTLTPQQMSFAHGLKALKALRGLRPLRMINRFKGLRIAMNTILKSGQQIFNIVALALIVIVIFAVCFSQIFKGTFYRCVIDGNPETAIYDDRIDTKQDCLALGYAWENPQEHFDDLSNTILNLMIFMTNENWTTVMYRAVDARGVDLQPKRNSNIQNIIVFILYMTVSHVFILNLFVGVIIQRFNSMNEIVQGYKGNKINSRKWIDIQRLMMKQKLQPKWFIPPGGVQRVFALICLSRPFEPFIHFTIVCNLVVLAMPYNGMSKTYADTLDKCSFAFSVIYNVEAFVKLMGLRLRYFHEAWNIMDLFIVILSNVGAILQTYTTVEFTALMPVIRAMRVARILKLIKGSSGLKVIVKALVSLSLNLINILGLLILLVFIYAVLGMNIFHGVMYQEHYNESTNFRSFDSSLILLIRCITGEGWDLIMHDLGLQGKSYDGTECVPDQTYQDWSADGILGCGFKFTYVFFFVFVVLSQMVFINLFIAFVLQAYKTSYDENFSLITLEDYDKLTTLWADYDPKATGMIEPQDMAFMLHELDGELGRAEEYQDIVKEIGERNENESNTKSVLQKNQRYVIKLDRDMILPVKVLIETLKEVSLPIYITADGHKCHFKDVCVSLSKSALVKQGILADKDTEGDNMLLSEWHANYEALKNQVQLEDQDSGSFWAGLFLARLISQMQKRHKYKAKKAECISEFNKRKEYSKMLRAKEEVERVENEVKELKKKANSHNMQDLDIVMRKKLLAYKQVKFKFDSCEDEDSPQEELIDLEHFIGNKSKPERLKTKASFKRLNIKNPAGTRDVDRSTWWKDTRDEHSTANSLKHWIKINDIRYGIEEEQERQKRLRRIEQQKSEAEQRRLEHVNRSIQLGSQYKLSGELTPVSDLRHLQNTSESCSSQPKENGTEMTERPLITGNNATEEDQLNMIRQWGSSVPPRLEISSRLHSNSIDVSTLLKSDSKSTIDVPVELEEQKHGDLDPKIVLLGAGADFMTREVSFNPKKSNNIEVGIVPQLQPKSPEDQSLRKSRTQTLFKKEKHILMLPQISEKTESRLSDRRVESNFESSNQDSKSKQASSNRSKSRPVLKDSTSFLQEKSDKSANVEEKKEVVVESPKPAPEMSYIVLQGEIKVSEDAKEQIAQRQGTAQFLQNKVLGIKVALPKSQFGSAPGNDDMSDCTSIMQEDSDTQSEMTSRKSSGSIQPVGKSSFKPMSKRKSSMSARACTQPVAISQFYKQKAESDASESESCSGSVSDSEEASERVNHRVLTADGQSARSKREHCISDSSAGSLNWKKSKKIM